MIKQQKVKQSNPPLKENPRALQILQKPTESPADALAHTVTRPTVQAATTLMNYNKDFGEIAINTLVNDLETECKLANNGDLRRAETILMAQAQTLDSIFNNLARRAALNIGEYMNATDTYLRLALRAQAQCRATLETLSMIKNPQPVAFVRQANIAHGPQQVNNATARTKEQSRTGNIENSQNNLWSPSVINGWTSERKTRQAELIHNWKPWQRSTGPRTLAGKAKVSRNAYKGGVRPLLRTVARLLREQKEVL